MNFDSEAYSFGYSQAERRIKANGVEVAKAISDAGINDVSDFALGYRTAIGVHLERQMSN